ncbi:hypothetical protein JHD50_11885 [Sulfurimonas sp. MAG313]|nr:methyltransferase [Sulfurimonas sp. MAG313]MDF1881989.1 hypothetical protein [Sulfurimonas sp. MAG313]
MKKIFQYQLYHLLLALVFIIAVAWVFTQDSDISLGRYYGVNSAIWFWIGIVIPIFHQLYVTITWRLELYKQSLTRLFGERRAFVLYAIGFAILFSSRFLVVIVLSLSNAHTLAIEPMFAYVMAGLITPFVVYLFYSVKKYFTIERAFGIDHFDKNYNVPYVKGGIFKYTDNAMYIVGLLILFIPGLVLLSKAALIVALFNYLYIWVHFYCTEEPDMKEIYGNTPKDINGI